MFRRMLCRVVVDGLLDANQQPHVEIDVGIGGGGDGEQAGDGGGEEALEEPGYLMCNMSSLKLVKKGSIDACHLKQPLDVGKSQLVLTNLHDGLAIGPKWDAPKQIILPKWDAPKQFLEWDYIELGVGVHKAGSIEVPIEVHLNDRGFVVWNGKHGEMVFDERYPDFRTGRLHWLRTGLVEGGSQLLLLEGVGKKSDFTSQFWTCVFRCKTMCKTIHESYSQGRLFTQNADGSISPAHAPHLVLGAKRPSANEMKRELLKEVSGLGLALAWCGRSAEAENACIAHQSGF